jgi:hypothetical protein
LCKQTPRHSIERVSGAFCLRETGGGSSKPAAPFGDCRDGVGNWPDLRPSDPHSSRFPILERSLGTAFSRLLGWTGWWGLGLTAPAAPRRDTMA